MRPAERIANLLGGTRVLRLRVRSLSDLERVIRAGLPKRSLQLVARRALPDDIPTSTLVYGVVPSATFKRRARLSLEESERTERLARVVALTESIVDQPEQAKAFLNRPHPLLEERTPLQAAHTEIGARRVEQLLHDVAHGLPL